MKVTGLNRGCALGKMMLRITKTLLLSTQPRLEYICVYICMAIWSVHLLLKSCLSSNTAHPIVPELELIRSFAAATKSQPTGKACHFFMPFSYTW